MADVDMTDAPVPAKRAAGKSKAADGGADGKKRFEVKKVGLDGTLQSRRC